MTDHKQLANLDIMELLNSRYFDGLITAAEIVTNPLHAARAIQIAARKHSEKQQQARLAEILKSLDERIRDNEIAVDELQEHERNLFRDALLAAASDDDKGKSHCHDNFLAWIVLHRPNVQEIRIIGQAIQDLTSDELTFFTHFAIQEPHCLHLLNPEGITINSYLNRLTYYGLYDSPASGVHVQHITQLGYKLASMCIYSGHREINNEAFRDMARSYHNIYSPPVSF